jgi:hypothetical protein
MAGMTAVENFKRYGTSGIEDIGRYLQRTSD